MGPNLSEVLIGSESDDVPDTLGALATFIAGGEAGL